MCAFHCLSKYVFYFVYFRLIGNYRSLHGAWSWVHVFAMTLRHMYICINITYLSAVKQTYIYTSINQYVFKQPHNTPFIHVLIRKQLNSTVLRLPQNANTMSMLTVNFPLTCIQIHTLLTFSYGFAKIHSRAKSGENMWYLRSRKALIDYRSNDCSP